jgi:hypothetical protein
MTELSNTLVEIEKIGVDYYGMTISALLRALEAALEGWVAAVDEEFGSSTTARDLLKSEIHDIVLEAMRDK